MNKTNDFAGDLKTISATVESDVGTIMKLVRENQYEVKPPAKPATSKERLPEQSIHDGPSPTAQVSTPTTNRGRTSRSAIVQTRVPSAEHAVLINVTTRLRRDTNERLTDAALHQRLRRAFPASRQDIIEQAVQEWLLRCGYS